MGVLNIRMAQETHNAPSGVAIQAQRQNLIRPMDEGMRGLNASLSQGAQAGIRIMDALKDKEDRRQADNAIAEVQSRYNAHMIGDGSNGSGAMNADFKDGVAWMQGNADGYRKILEDVKKTRKLTDRQMALARQGLESYEINWQNRMATKANEVYEKSRLDGAVGRRDQAELDLSLGSTPEGWKTWVDSVNEELDVKRVHDPAARQAYFRKRGLSVVQTELARRVKEYAALNAESEDSKAVGEFYDAKIKELTDNPSSLLPQSEELKAALGKDGIGAPATDKDGKKTEATGIFKAYLTDLKAAKQRAMHNADARKMYKIREVAYDSQNAETDMILGKGWEEMTDESKADAYKKHLSDPSGKTDNDGNPLTWEQAYKLYSPVRGKAIQRTIDTYTKQAKAGEARKADAAWKKREEEIAVALTQPFIYQTDEQGNIVYDAHGAPMVEPLTPQRRMDMAFKLWQDKGDGTRTISEATRNKIVAANRVEFNENAKQVCREVLQDIGVSYPNAVAYRAKDGADGSGEFYVKTDSHVKKPSQVAKSDFHNNTGDWSWYWDDAEDVAYSDCADAMNITMQWMMKHPDASVEDGKKYYRSILEGKDTDGKYRRMKMQAHFEDEQRKLGIVESNILSTPASSAAFSFGISPSGSIRTVNHSQKKETK